MEDLGKPACFKRSYEIEIDQCQSHFNALLIADTDDVGSNSYYDTYMKRKCDFETSVTCSQNGTPCDEITECSNDNLEYDYEFCIRTGFEDHRIQIQKYYGKHEVLPSDCFPMQEYSLCRKTMAYIGSWSRNKILPKFPNFWTIGHTKPEKCWTKTVTKNTCASEKIPGASIEAFGRVEWADGPDAIPVRDFQYCSANATIPPVYFASDSKGIKSDSKGGKSDSKGGKR